MTNTNDTTGIKNYRRKQAGNAIVMLFAAIGMAGMVTYGLNNVMRGPGIMTAEVSRKTIAENNMIATTRLAISAATRSQTNEGDCDSDGFVEPVPYRDAGALPKPTGGGLLPMTIGASMTDPWGAQYGYCAWDAGTVKTSDNHAGCGGSSARRLNGGPKDNQPAIAVISAGKNGVFETSCVAYVDTTPADGIPDASLINKPGTSDDVVLSYTYSEANGIGGGEWKLKTADSTTAEVGKNLEVRGGGTFSGPVELTTEGLVLPGDPGDNSITGACNAAKDQQLRRNTSTTPPTLEICDSSGTGWSTISGGSAPTDASFDTNGYNCTANSGGPLTQAGSIAVTNGHDVWSDGYYIYVTENTALGVYSFDGATFTRVDGFAGPAANSVVEVTGDGRYIYILDDAANELEAWTFDGTTATLIDTAGSSTFQEDIWSDGTYIYTATNADFRAYSFDGADLTLRDTEVVNTMGVWGDGTYIYTAGSNALRAWTFNGTSLTQVATTTLGGDTGYETWGDDTYIYVSAETGIKAFTFNGTAFTLAANNTAIDAWDVWGDGVNVFASTLTGPYALEFTGSAFTTDSSVALATNGAPQIFGDGNYIYTFGGTSPSFNLVAYGGYKCTAPPPLKTITAPPSGGSVTPIDPEYLDDALDAGLIALWPLNEGTGTTIEDVIGTYDGTFINSPVWNNGPNNDGGLSFDMDDRDAVQINGLMGSPATGTIGLWVNAGRFDIGNGTAQSSFFSVGDIVSIEQRADVGLAAYFHQGAGVWLRVDSNLPIQSTGWHYVTVTWDDAANNWRLYMDGIMVGSSTTAITLTYTGQGSNTFIGRAGNGDVKLDLDGGVDDVRMYNRTLSSAEVAMLYKKVKNASLVRDVSAIPPSNNIYKNLLTANDAANCAIKLDGTPWCWGDDTSENLGNGTSTVDQASPVAVSIPTTQTFYVTNTNSDILPASNLYSKTLEPLQTVAAGTSATALAAGATNNGYAITPAGIYGKDDGGGRRSYSVTVSSTVATATACMQTSVFAARINSSGTIQGAEVQLGSTAPLTGATTTFSGEADLGTFSATDRLQFRYQMYNFCAASQIPTINFGLSSTVTLPATEYPAWTQISSQRNFTCAIRADGTLWCWGDDTSGRLGNGTIETAVKTTPFPVVSTSVRWTKVSAGIDHACGIKEDGTLWCWGADASGQQGNGAGGATAIPVIVPGGFTDWQDVSAGNLYTCAIRSNGGGSGNLGYCWGEAGDGQIANNSTTDQQSPVVLPIAGWTSINARQTHTCGVTIDGTGYCWGDDTYEQLGLPGVSIDQLLPVKVSDPGPWTEIVPGDHHTCGIKADSTVWCWGRYENNRLGVTTTAHRSRPLMIPGSKGTVALTTGTLGGCLMKADRSVWCWGSDADGQIGNGAVTTAEQVSPTAVLGFGGKPGWSWNDAGTAIVPPPGTNVALNGNYLSDTSTAQGLGFTASGKANLRQLVDPNQLLLETTATGASSQMSFSINSGVTYTDYTTGAQGWWRFDAGAGTSAVDSSGNSNTGTLTNGPTWTTGVDVGAVDFDGANDYVAIANSASLQNAITNMTVAGWVNPDNASAVNFIFYKGTAANANNVQVSLATYMNEVLFSYCSANSASCSTWNVQMTSGAALQSGQWYHIAASYSRNNFLNLYVNGVVVSSVASVGAPLTAQMRSTTQPATIGRGWGADSTQYYAAGLLDDVRVYNAALTSAQVFDIYASKVATGKKPHTLGIDHSNNNFEIGRNVVGSTNWLSAINPDIAITSTGNVGVGTATPAVKMDVAGGVKIGTENYCGPGRDGGLRFTGFNYQYCDGTNWIDFQEGYTGANCTGKGSAAYNDVLTGQCYFLLTGAHTFAGAQSACVSNGGYLVSVDSDAENNIIWDQFLVEGWINLTDAAVEGTWNYATGPKTGQTAWLGASGGAPQGGNYTHFSAGEPNGGAENCAAMVGGGGRWWIDTSCGAAYNAFCEMDSPGSNTSCPNIGDVCSDGTVYAGLSPDGGARMYTTPADTDSGVWCAAGQSGNYAETFIDDDVTGAANTAAILAIDANTSAGGFQTHEAVSICAADASNGQSDWYLPAEDELEVMYANKSSIGGFANDEYWSSTEAAQHAAILVNFTTGVPVASTKNSTRPFRCVRKSNSDIGLPTPAWKATRMPSYHNTIATTGNESTSAIKADGTAWSWGNSQDFVLGNNDNVTDTDVPVAVHSDASSTGFNDWVSISLGWTWGCGLRANGTYWCWGESDGEGWLGSDDPNETEGRPTQVLNSAGGPGWSDWVQGDKSCGVRANGTAWCWGDDANGNTGTGTSTADEQVPTLVAGGYTDWLMVKQGGFGACGLRANGTLWCWGGNWGGMLGNNNSPVGGSNIPRQVVGDVTPFTPFTDWIYVSSGGQHNCGIRANHRLYCWGDGSPTCVNGNGGCFDNWTPLEVHSDTNPYTPWSDWITVSAGPEHTCGIRANGMAYCWGTNTDGRLGDASVTTRDRPSRVTDSAGTGYWSDWVDISAGPRHSCGVRASGDMYCWGFHGDGRLGTGDGTGGSTVWSPQLVINE